jgi:hypothetical protein
MTKKNIIYISISILVIFGVVLFKFMQQTGVTRTAAFRVLVYPEKYTLSMSSTPGIRLQADYDSSFAKVRYATERGLMLTWDDPRGKISQGVSLVEVPYELPVYWSPIELRSKYQVDDNIIITITLLSENGEQIAEEQINIIEDGLFYTVKADDNIVIGIKSNPELQAPPQTLDEAVSIAVKGRRTAYGQGEVATEGHIILDSENLNGQIKVYTISSFGAFGFENGIFTKVSGSGAIPTVITFTKQENGTYLLAEYQEPMDGAMLIESTKKLFPAKLHERVLSAGKDYEALRDRQETQAKAYLQSIGRVAQVSEGHVPKTLAKIDVEASNKLFTELNKYNRFLNDCPYWLGTREQLEAGVRYIYETSQSKTEDGFDLITFQKKKEDGTIVQEAKYKIIGGETHLIK